MADAVVSATVEEVLTALERVDLGRPWEAIAHQVRPVLARRRPLPLEADPPVRWSWPCGLEGTFGLDIGPAFLYVGAWTMRQWGVTEAELAERALHNVRELARVVGPGDLSSDALAGMPMTAFQSGDGWASALLLVPEVVARIFGDGPALLLAPMRDLLIRLPADADPDVAAWIRDDFAALDPNGLAVPLMRFEDGEVRLATHARTRAASGARHH